MSTTEPIRNIEVLHLFKKYYQTIEPNPRNYTIIIVGLNSILRISDILHLTYGNIYDYEKCIWKTHLQVIEEKTGKSNCIYINQEMKSTLKQFASIDMHTSEDWLFAGNNSLNPLSRYQAYRIIKRAADYYCPGQSVSCHSLRKTFGYHAWKQGIPPAILMNIYNHSSYQITKRYLGIDQDDKDDVFRNISL